MLTDLHLQKYLEGRLSKKEEQELEVLLEKNPSLQQRLQELEARDNTVLRPRWERVFLNRGSRQGSRVRYSTILPALVLLLLLFALTAHWFGKPGANSTFLQAGGNGTAVDLLYHSAGDGWRYLDAGFHPGDSLTIAVRDTGHYAVRVFALYAGLPEPVAQELWSSPEDRRFGKGDPKPVFASRPHSAPPSLPRYLALIYDTGSVASFDSEDVVGLLRAGAGAGGGRQPSFQYQVFRVPEPGP